MSKLLLESVRKIAGLEEAADVNDEWYQQGYKYGKKGQTMNPGKGKAIGAKNVNSFSKGHSAGLKDGGWSKTPDHMGKYSRVSESHMSEVHLIMQEIASGIRNVEDVMNNPKTPEEQYAARQLQNMYNEIASQHGLHPDDDFERIQDRMMDQLEQDYGTMETKKYSKEVLEALKIAGIAEAEYKAEPKVSDTPAAKRKASGKNFPLTHDDLKKEDEDNASSTAGLAKRKKDLGMAEMLKIAGVPLSEAWDDDDEDPDVKTAMKDKRQQEFEKKNKKTIGKVDADKDMARLAKSEKKTDSEDDDTPAEKKAEAKPAAKKEESKPAASGGSFAAIARQVLKAGGNASAVRAALAKAGVAEPAHLHSRLHALKKNLKEGYILVHPQMSSFYLAENMAMNQYQWVSNKDDSTTLYPMIFETKEAAEKVAKYAYDYKNQVTVITPIKFGEV